jgi:hypothetical protein
MRLVATEYVSLDGVFEEPGLRHGSPLLLVLDSEPVVDVRDGAAAHEVGTPVGCRPVADVHHGRSRGNSGCRCPDCRF